MRTLVILATTFAAAAPAGAATISLDTSIFPSAQGWTFVGTDEASAFRIEGGELVQTTVTRGLGAAADEAYYTRPIAIGPGDRFALTMVASIESFTNPDGVSFPFGFSFGVGTPAQYSYVGLAGLRIAATTVLPVTDYFEYPVGFSQGDFNTYRLSGGGGRATLTLNGVAVFSNAAFTPVFGSQLLFGDGTFLGNADGRIRSLEFSSGAVPEPASWALLITGFGLTGATLRRARAVAA